MNTQLGASLFTFLFDDFSIRDSGILRSPTTTVLVIGLIYGLTSSSTCVVPFDYLVSSN